MKIRLSRKTRSEGKSSIVEQGIYTTTYVVNVAMGKNAAPRPPAYTNCPLCQKEFGSASIERHVIMCASKHNLRLGEQVVVNHQYVANYAVSVAMEENGITRPRAYPNVDAKP